MKLLTLRKRSDFIRVSQKGKKIIEKSFILQGSVPDASQDFPRFGFVITKKHGNAVRRNLLKRRIKAILQDMLKQNEIPSLDYVIVPHPHIALKTPFQDLGDMLKRAFTQFQSIEDTPTKK